jgi:hypothetical protein
VSGVYLFRNRCGERCSSSPCSHFNFLFSHHNTGHHNPLIRQGRAKKISVYNLHLVYLAIPDLIMSISFILMVIKCHYDDSLWVTFSSAFLSKVSVNVAILHELLKLLVNSKTRRRSTPLSLLKASTQVLAMYAVSITSGLLALYLDQYVTFFTLLGCAFVYFLWVLLRICYGRLLCYNSDTLRRLKVLVIYFSRIICLKTWSPEFFAFFSIFCSIFPTTTFICGR